jgi:O-antigen/teichoic acid export membrane protein
VSLLRKTFVLGMGAGAARLLGAAILILLARVLGPARFGVFGYAMSLALLLEVGIDMGQSVHIGRIVSREPTGGPGVFQDVLLNKSLFSLVAAFGAWSVLRLSGTAPDEALTVAFMVVWGGFLSILDSERAVARALGMFVSDSVVNSVESLARLLGILAVVALGAGLVGVGAAFALECGVSAVVFYFVLARHAKLAPEKASFARARRFLAESTPLGLSGIAIMGFYQIDQVFVRTLAGATANGMYGAAARVVFAANGFAGLVAIAAYPGLSRAYRDRKEFRRRLAGALRLAAPAGAAVSLIALIFATPIVRLLYGTAYDGAIPLLRVLAPVVLLDGIVVSGLNAGNALGRERRVLVVIGTMFALNVVSNWLLVPRFGAYAAAWISTVGEALLAAGLLAVCWDHIAFNASADGEQDEETAC